MPVVPALIVAKSNGATLDCVARGKQGTSPSRVIHDRSDCCAIICTAGDLGDDVNWSRQRRRGSTSVCAPVASLCPTVWHDDDADSRSS